VVALIPRYHAFLGWIEIFGLPPQHEWCILKDLKSFKKNAKLVVNNITFDESIEFYKDKDTHFVAVYRSNEDIFENFYWYKNTSSNGIKEEGYFEHSNGIYIYRVKKKMIKKVKALDSRQRRFFEEITKKEGNPDVIILKNFKAKGTKMPIYYLLFPTLEVLDTKDIENCKGWLLEIGYLNKIGDEIDKVHGRWFKLIHVNDKCFFVVEGNWSSTVVEVDGIRERVKKSYSKELYDFKHEQIMQQT